MCCFGWGIVLNYLQFVPQVATMQKKYQSLKAKMIDAYADKTAKLRIWNKSKTQAFKAKLKARWTKFQGRHPRINKVLRKVLRNKFTKGLAKLAEKYKFTLINAGKVLVVSFFAGKEPFTTRCRKKQE